MLKDIKTILIIILIIGLTGAGYFYNKKVKEIEEAREGGIRDAESTARYHNRNRNYKESWEGDD